MPRVINIDGNAPYPPALTVLQAEGTLAPECQLRPVQYLNKRIEQDHRFIKRRVKPGAGFGSYQTAWRTLPGDAALQQLRKGHVPGTTKGGIVSQNRFIAAALGVPLNLQQSSRGAPKLPRSGIRRVFATQPDTATVLVTGLAKSRGGKRCADH